MRICGVGCVNDNHALLATTIKHLVLNGVSDFYLYDHGSEPGIADFLSAELGSGTIRLSILRKETQPFFQREMTAVLTDLAEQDGFDAAVAFDADEFWCSTVEGQSLVDRIELELLDGIDALRVRVLNYVQHRAIDTFQADSLSRCQYSVLPHLDPLTHPRDQVEAGLPFVAMPFPSKVILRLAKNVKYTMGQHDFTKNGGSARVIEATGIILRHLPLPCRRHLFARREQAQRLITAGYSPELGWQTRRLADHTDAQLNDYWLNNSWDFAEDQRALVGTYDKLVKDDSLLRIQQDLVLKSDRFPGSQERRAPALGDIPGPKLQGVIQHLVDDLGKAEATIQELRQVLGKSDAMIASPWWCLRLLWRTILQPTRSLEKRFRHYRKNSRRRLSIGSGSLPPSTAPVPPTPLQGQQLRPGS